jgi:hypothetical protein
MGRIPIPHDPGHLRLNAGVALVEHGLLRGFGQVIARLGVAGPRDDLGDLVDHRTVGRGDGDPLVNRVAGGVELRAILIRVHGAGAGDHRSPGDQQNGSGNEEQLFHVTKLPISAYDGVPIAYS